MKRIIFLIAATLAGCATSSILQKQPVMSLSSSRSADHLEECIALVLPGAVNTIRGEGRRTITAGSGIATIAAVTITEGTPATIELRQGTPIHGSIRDKIRRCAE